MFPKFICHFFTHLNILRDLSRVHDPVYQCQKHYKKQYVNDIIIKWVRSHDPSAVNTERVLALLPFLRAFRLAFVME